MSVESLFNVVVFDTVTAGGARGETNGAGVVTVVTGDE